MDRLTMRQGKHVYTTNKAACVLNGYHVDSVSTFCENTQCLATKDRTCPYLMVIDRLADYEDAVEKCLRYYDAAKDTEKRLLGEVLALFGEVL